MGGWRNTRESDRIITMISEPPRSDVELRHGRSIEERRPMEISQCLDNVIIGRIDDTNFVHGVTRKQNDLDQGDVTARNAHLLSTTFTPSQIAPIRPVAMTVITALKV